MGCSSCQQNNHVVPSTHVHNQSSQTHCECACGCSEPICPTPQPCTEITDSKCIIYTDLAIKCGNDTVVSQGSSVSRALNQIVNYFCTQESLVYESNPDKLEASYGKLVPILVKAIQDLSAKVEALENK